MKQAITICMLLLLSVFNLKAQTSTKTIIFDGLPQENQNVSKKGTPPFVPIIVGGCICVTGEDCPCDRPPIIIWLPTNKILKSYPSKTKNSSGKNLIRYEIQSDAEIRIEAYVPMNVRNFAASYTNVRNNQLKTQKTAAVIDAFTLGWKIGTFIDKETGVSDWLADKFCDWFGGCK